MPNPFRSEAEAYRFVWLTIGGFALIAVASFVTPWLGVAVAVVLAIALVRWMGIRRREAPVQTATRARSAENEKRILVIANETVGGSALRETIKSKSENYREDVLVVCPALNS